MSHHTATLQSAFDKTASVLDFAYTVADRLYWLDDNYVQPFYSWAAPRLREAAISGIYWALVTLIDVSLWLIDTTRQFFARDAQAIALHAFAHAHEPLPEFPALPPAPVALALPSMAPAPVFPSPVVRWGSVPEVLDDADPVLALCPARVPMALRSSINPDHSVRRWLAAALPLVVAPVAEDAPVKTLGKTPRKTRNTTNKTDATKSPRKRSHKAKTAAAAR
jgi:hypothetical protein